MITSDFLGGVIGVASYAVVFFPGGSRIGRRFGERSLIGGADERVPCYSRFRIDSGNYNAYSLECGAESDREKKWVGRPVKKVGGLPSQNIFCDPVADIRGVE